MISHTYKNSKWVRYDYYQHIKVGLSPCKKVAVICFNESPLKMMKNASHFMLKALFVLERCLQFCPDFIVRGRALSTYATFSEKLTFLTPWYAHARVRIRGLEMLVFQKILRTYVMDGSLDRKRLISKKVNFKIYEVTGWTTTITICILLNISRTLLNISKELDNKIWSVNRI